MNGYTKTLNLMRFEPRGNLAEGSSPANTQKIVEKNSKCGNERLYKNPKFDFVYE